jgi:hypothetical protein
LRLADEHVTVAEYFQDEGLYAGEKDAPGELRSLGYVH